MKLTKTHIKRMILESLLNEGMADFKATAGTVDAVIRPALQGAVQDALADVIKDKPELTDQLALLKSEMERAIDVALANMEQRLLKKRA